jgi:hypothetical protein
LPRPPATPARNIAKPIQTKRLASQTADLLVDVSDFADRYELGVFANRPYCGARGPGAALPPGEDSISGPTARDTRPGAVMESMDVSRAILMAVITIPTYLWLRRKFTPSLLVSPLPANFRSPESTTAVDLQPASADPRQVPQLGYLGRIDEDYRQEGCSPPNVPHHSPDCTVAKVGDEERNHSNRRHLPERGLTFRVLGMPCAWDENRLQSFLADQDGWAGPTISSLAEELGSQSFTATVSFQKVPRQLQALRMGNIWKVPLPRGPDQSTRLHTITLDLGFIGMTTLYAPPSQDHKVEYVRRKTSQLYMN